jgi:hypothetical protein
MSNEESLKNFHGQRAYALLVVLSILAIAGALLFLWASYVKRLSEQKADFRYQVETEQVLSYATHLAISQLESAIQEIPYCVTRENHQTYILKGTESIPLTSEPIAAEDSTTLLVSKDKTIPAVTIKYGSQDYTLVVSWSTEEQNYALGQNMNLVEETEGYSSKDSDKIEKLPLPRTPALPALTLGTPHSSVDGITTQSIQDGISEISELSPYADQENPFDIISERTLYNVPMLKQIPDSAQDAIAPETLQQGVPFGINPIPVDIKLTGSFFHTQHDNLHRFRFYMDSIWWNPYPLPIDFGSEDRAYIIVWDMLPEWEIENEHTGEILSFDLSNLPIEDTDNSENEITPHAWMTFKSAYIREGEIYAIEEPSQSEGLARTLSTSEWIYSKNGWKPPKVWGDNWIAASNTISTTPANTPNARIRIYPFTEKLADDQTIEDYGTPILEIRNIPFEYPEIEITGATYSRENSTEFTRDDALFQWQIHLKDTTGNLETLLALWDPRCPVWDLNDPIVASLFDVQFSFRESNDDSFEEISQNTFTDSKVNSHTTPITQYRLFDVLTELPESIGSFRSLCFPDNPPLSLGEQGGQNQLFDEICAASIDALGFHASLNVNTMTEETWGTLLQRSYTRFPSVSKVYSNLPSATLTESQAELLAKNIVQQIQEKGPFQTLKAFYDADVFNTALEATGITLTTDEISLRGSDIAAVLSQLLSVKSDSFCSYIAIELYRKEDLVARQNREVQLQIVYDEDTPKVEIMSIRPITYNELH